MTEIHPILCHGYATVMPRLHHGHAMTLWHQLHETCRYRLHVGKSGLEWRVDTVSHGERESTREHKRAEESTREQRKDSWIAHER